MSHLRRLQAAQEYRFSEKLFDAPLPYIKQTVYEATESREEAQRVMMEVYRQRIIADLEGY